ncbi:MAG: 1-acyl-sn-glycerol-3-phosphate acyltransferase [Hydrogenophaga sp.]|uniref:1-acyl-sn-glycerol-3-phosphate acyltransferase n=1 Tax=Hydrogenophaga sp. TaxID=1904254 RepID=UPI0040362ABA
MSLSADYPGPHTVRFRGSSLSRWLLARMGWQLDFDGFPRLQGVAIVYPHTSNWDFPIMLLVKWAIGVPARFWGKDALFRVPLLGAWMRWLGGIPLHRQSPQGVVGHMVALMQQHKQEQRLLWLALSPEGTRRRTQGWRSGFYQVALGADVPLALVRLDYSRKTVSVTDFLRLTGDEAADYARMAASYDGVRGLHAEFASPVQPLSKPFPAHTV